MAAWRNALARASQVEKERLNRILMIGVPIIVGMLSQSLMNLVDAAMVGRLGGNELAAIGVGSYATFLVVSAMMGLSAAVQAIVARHHGGGRTAESTEPLFAGITLTLIAGIPMTLFFLLLAPQYLALYTNDQTVIDIAVPYFQWRTAALIFVGMAFVFRGFWSGIGEAWVYLRITLIMHISNAVLSWLFIYGTADWGTGIAVLDSWTGYGATGSGMGSAAALLLAAILFFWHTFVTNHARFSVHYHLSGRTLRQLTRLAIPNSIQQTLFALGVSVLFFIIGLLGTDEQAIGHILTQLSLLLIMPAVGLGIAGASLVGHALGAEEKENAHRWGWDVVRVSMVMMAVMGLPLWIAPDWVLHLFTPDDALVALGEWPLRIIGFSIPFEVAAIILTQTLLGAGASKQVMKINLVMQWLLFLPLAWIIGPYLGFGLIGVWLLQSLNRITLSLIYGTLWGRKQWVHIKV